MPSPVSPESNVSSRRDFLRNSTAAVVGGSVAATLGSARMVHAAGDDVIKVALIGCGSRGSGAAVNATNSDKNIKITVLADAFKDQLDHARDVLSKQIGDKLAVPAEHCFHGFDAYEKVMQTDVDVVLLCTPPHFRPAHLKAAIAANKHVFCEKPVAVDGPGVRSVLATCEEAKQKNLSIVSGLCWRYDYGVRETIKQIQDGAIGDIVAIQENYLANPLWHRPRQAEWSEMEYQMRNWLYYTWLSGDHIVEQHVHSLDKAMWLMGDKPPENCFGLGGRQVRIEEKWGHIFDHFAVCFEWANGVRMYSYTRQMANCHSDVDDYVLGTKGQAVVLKHTIKGEKNWRYKGDKPSMYDVEHRDLYAGIRSGNIINNGQYMSNSTLLAIMGREACYTGQRISWQEAMESSQNLSPPKYDWSDLPIPNVATPGVTQFA